MAAIAKEHVAVICHDRTARTSALVMALAQLLGARLCYAHALPLVGTLRIRGAVVSDHLMMERLLKLYGAYLSLYGATIDNVMSAPYDLVLYLARTEKELRDVKEVVDDVLGEVAELERKLEKAKELLLAGNVRGLERCLERCSTATLSGSRGRRG